MELNIIIKSMPKLISLEYLEEKDCMQFIELRGVLSCTLPVVASVGQLECTAVLLYTHS